MANTVLPDVNVSSPVIKYSTDTLICRLQGIGYQGPTPIALFLRSSVGHPEFNNGQAIFASDLLNPFVLNIPFDPASQSHVIRPAVGGIDLVMPPVGEVQFPLAPADGMLQVSLDPNWQSTWSVFYKHAYNIVIPLPNAVIPPGNPIAYPNLINGGYDGSGNSSVDLTWTRSPSWQSGMGEFVDICIADTLEQAEAAFQGQVNVNYISIDTHGPSVGLLLNIPTMPGRHHWWRVTENINGQWYWTPTVGFISASIGPVGGTPPNVTDLQAVFS